MDNRGGYEECLSNLLRRYHMSVHVSTSSPKSKEDSAHGVIYLHYHNVPSPNPFWLAIMYSMDYRDGQVHIHDVAGLNRKVKNIPTIPIKLVPLFLMLILDRYERYLTKIYLRAKPARDVRKGSKHSYCLPCYYESLGFRATQTHSRMCRPYLQKDVEDVCGVYVSETLVALYRKSRLTTHPWIWYGFLIRFINVYVTTKTCIIV